MEERTTGIVKWFSHLKGYGFIGPDDSDKDVFVHYSSIIGGGYRNLSEGQRVEFSIEDTPKGLTASNVVELASANDN